MRLSESSIWSDSRRYYQAAGLAAWARDQLPTRICNNAATADVYASAIHQFAAEVGAGAERVHVLELGGGTGCFAHLVLSSLGALREALGAPGPALRYVLTDVVESTIAHWREHPRLRSWVRHGDLDRAYFDVLEDRPLELLESGEVLSRETTTAPMVVIANYLFDSLPCDVFRVRNRLEEASPIVDRPLWTGDPREQFAPVRFEYSLAAEPVYQDPVLADICARYAARFEDTAFSIPVGSVRCLRRLRELTTGPILVISADKGYVNEEELTAIKAPAVIQHGGAISMTVNFDALCKVVTAEGGYAMHTTGRTANLQVAMFFLGMAAPPARTRAVFHDLIDRRGPLDSFPLIEMVAHAELTVELAISVLRSAAMDPHVFLMLNERLRDLLDSADPAQRRCLVGLVQRVLVLHFPQPDVADVAFEVGVCLASMGQPREALAALAESRDIYGPAPHSCFAMAMSHLMLGAPELALPLLEQTLALDPGHAGAITWRSHVAAQLEDR
jgi:hypothetical protein